MLGASRTKINTLFCTTLDINTQKKDFLQAASINFTLLLRVFLPLADDGALHGFAVELPVVVDLDGPDGVAPLDEDNLALKQQRVFTWEQT